MGPLLKYRLSIDHYLSRIFARRQDATSVGGVCSGGRQFATPGDRIAMLFAAVCWTLDRGRDASYLAPPPRDPRPECDIRTAENTNPPLSLNELGRAQRLEP